MHTPNQTVEQAVASALFTIASSLYRHRMFHLWPERLRCVRCGVEWSFVTQSPNWKFFVDLDPKTEACSGRYDGRFPILFNIHTLEQYNGLPRSVPWDLVATEVGCARAVTNHEVGLRLLGYRGGVEVEDLWCIVHDKGLDERPTTEVAVAWLRTVEAP